MRVLIFLHAKNSIRDLSRYINNRARCGYNAHNEPVVNALDEL